MPKKAKQTTADIHRAVAQKVIVAAMETHGSDGAKSGPCRRATGRFRCRPANIIRASIG